MALAGGFVGCAAWMGAVWVEALWNGGLPYLWGWTLLYIATCLFNAFAMAICAAGFYNATPQGYRR